MEALSSLASSELTLIVATLGGLALTAVAIVRDVDWSNISDRTST